MATTSTGLHSFSKSRFRSRHQQVLEQIESADNTPASSLDHNKHQHDTKQQLFNSRPHMPRPRLTLTSSRSELTNSAYMTAFFQTPPPYTQYSNRRSRSVSDITASQRLAHSLGLHNQLLLILCNATYLQLLLQFMISEYNEELLHFLLAVERYRKDATRLNASAVYKQYICADGVDCVNIPSRVRETAEHTLAEFPDVQSTLFDEASNVVMHLIEQSVLPRFLESAAWRDASDVAAGRTVRSVSQVAAPPMQLTATARSAPTVNKQPQLRRSNTTAPSALQQGLSSLKFSLLSGWFSKRPSVASSTQDCASDIFRSVSPAAEILTPSVISLVPSASNHWAPDVASTSHGMLNSLMVPTSSRLKPWMSDASHSKRASVDSRNSVIMRAGRKSLSRMADQQVDATVGHAQHPPLHSMTRVTPMPSQDCSSISLTPRLRRATQVGGVPLIPAAPRKNRASISRLVSQTGALTPGDVAFISRDRARSEPPVRITAPTAQRRLFGDATGGNLVECIVTNEGDLLPAVSLDGKPTPSHEAAADDGCVSCGLFDAIVQRWHNS